MKPRSRNIVWPSNGAGIRWGKGGPRGVGGGDRELVRKGRRIVEEARRRYGHLDAALERGWVARVLDHLVVDYGPWASAVFGDRELCLIREKWARERRSLNDRKAGMKVVRDAYCYVVGRGPCAPWNLARSYLERNADRFGLDRGDLRPDGRWSRAASQLKSGPPQVSGSSGVV